ncbi:DUF3027 domain-containing protein [Streptomyces sp. NPDC005438]|uniref:DUF3027 domain-containing protein n=1 Tax=Streptomyces sp. NPDC005438 TaxID=3156880 RepID=UPI0033BB5A48
MSAATRSTRSRRTPDRLCSEAVDLARGAAEEAARPGMVGEHLEAVWEGDRIVTHLFACEEPGYRGWHWAVTVARASRAKTVTLDEAVLLPGQHAILAPQWVPWSERLRPGDMGPGDLLPTESDDLRLEPGTSGEDSPPPNSALVKEPQATEPQGEAGPESEDGEEYQPEHPPTRAEIVSVAQELGMGRPRVLSRYGLQLAAERWEESHGPRTPMAQSAPGACDSCGFLVPLSGSLRQVFGVCANENSPADGHVVALDYGCGGHSERAVMPEPPRPPAPVIDETRVDPLELHQS